MAPRGLSADEKRVKLLEIFHETKDFFQLKELEKLGPKLKGIVSQSVKEVLQSAVDDGLVQADKIGSSNFFWSFPSERGAMMSNRLRSAEDTRDSLKAQLQEAAANAKTERASRVETAERTASLQRLASAKAELAMLKKEMSDYCTCDPVQVEKKQRAVRLANEAAVRWTDNVSLLVAYFTRQTSVDPSELRQFLGIHDDFEDIC